MNNINLAVIPARGGSKGIPKKNTRMLGGKPLLVWTIEAAQKSKYINKIIVSTDDKDISDIAKNCGVEVFDRTPELASDGVHATNIVKDCIKKYDKKCSIVEKVTMLLPTSPLRTAADIDNAISMFDYYSGSSVVGVCKSNKPISSFRHIKKGNILYPIKNTDNYEVQRQDISRPIYEVNGAIFIATSKHIKAYGSFHQGNPLAYVMNKINSIDINDMEDLDMVEAILRGRI